MKAGLIFILLSVFFAAVAADVRELSVLCQAAPERAIPEAKGAPVLVMQFAGENGLFRLEGVPISPKVGMQFDVAPTLGGRLLV